MDSSKPINKLEIYAAAILGIVLVIVLSFFISSLITGSHDSFAQCLTQKGVKFYGAFWCPHCAAQKDEFGNSMKYVNYVECANPDLSKTKICTTENISEYPTWILPNGTRYEGVLPLENLSILSGCTLK